MCGEGGREGVIWGRLEGAGWGWRGGIALSSGAHLSDSQPCGLVLMVGAGAVGAGAAEQPPQVDCGGC